MALTQTLSRQNADETNETLALDVSDALVMRAAQHLIVRHRQGQRFEIEALDVPHEALAAIAAQLEEAGLSHALSEPLVDALRGYIMAHGGSFARAANAKPVRISLVVADRMPRARFDQAVTELACLGAKEVHVEGATRVNVRATPSGTATSSNAADVDAIFAHVRGLYLWIRFEAPTKAELDGLMTSVEAALAGAAQSVGGAMGAGDLKALLQTLQKDGVLTPAIEAVINTLIQIQDGMGRDGKAALPPAAMGALVQELGTLIDKAQAQGLMPPALLSAVMTSLAAAAPDHPAIATFVAEQGFTALLADNDNISVDQRLENLMEKVQALQSIDGLDPALAQQIEALVEKAKADLAAGDVSAAAVLQALGEGLGEMAARGDLPAALAEGIGAVLPEIAALQDTPQIAQAAAADPAQGEALLVVLEEIAAQIEKGEIDIKDVPPELQALIEKMGGVETLTQKEGRDARIDTLAEAIAGTGDPQISDAAHAAILIMANPQAMEALPADLQQTIQTFITDHPAIVETAATQTVMREMNAALEAADPASPEVQEIKNAIQILKSDGLAAFVAVAPAGMIPPATLPVVQRVAQNPSAVVPSLPDVTPAQISKAIDVSAPAANAATLVLQTATPPVSAVTPVSAAPPVSAAAALPINPARQGQTVMKEAPRADIVTMAVSVRALATVLQVKPANAAVVPAPQKAAMVLLEQASAMLRTKDPAQPLSVADTKQVLQKLVDAKEKVADPVHKAAIEKEIRQLEKARPADGAAPQRPDPTPKPGCHPICKCLDGNKIEASREAHAEKSRIAAVTADGIVMKDGEKISHAQLETSKKNDTEAWARVNAAVAAAKASSFAGSDARDLLADLPSGDCPCGIDHGSADSGGGVKPSSVFGGAAGGAGVKTGTQVTESTVRSADELKKSTATAIMAASFGMR